MSRTRPLRLGEPRRTIAAVGKRERRRPKDLPELFAAQRLPADAPLLPGDDAVGFGWRGDAAKAILIEIRTHRHQRSVSTADGAVKQDYDPDAQQPIDAFATRR